MDSRSNHMRKTESVKLVQLLSLSIEPLSVYIRRVILRAQLRSLQRQAEYFEWQGVNAREGLADAHRRIAVVKSDLNSMR